MSSVDGGATGSSYAPAPEPAQEKERLEALRGYDILDSAEEDIYDAITRAAAEACQTSLASLTFVDKHRQWFKSRVGLKDKETDRKPAFCAFAINGGEPFLVEDTFEDPRFVQNPFVTGAPHLRFYAGMPLVTPDKCSIGTLCVLDTKPRKLAPEQLSKLRQLAENVIQLLEIRKQKGGTAYAKIVDLANDGIAVSAPDSTGDLRILYANDSYLRLTQTTLLEVLGQRLLSAFEREWISGLGLAKGEGKPSSLQPVGGEMPLRVKDGSTRWARYQFVPFFSETGNLLYALVILNDVTAMRETQLQTQQLHAMQTTLASISHIVNNFLNSAQLYAQCVAAAGECQDAIHGQFQRAIADTHRRLKDLQRMRAFRERTTSFGFTVLDPESGSDLPNKS